MILSLSYFFLYFNLLTILCMVCPSTILLSYDQITKLKDWNFSRDFEVVKRNQLGTIKFLLLCKESSIDFIARFPSTILSISKEWKIKTFVQWVLVSPFHLFFDPSHDRAEDDLVRFCSHQGRRGIAAAAAALVEVAAVVLLVAVVAVVGVGWRVVVETGGVRAVGVEPSRYPHPHVQQLHVLPHIHRSEAVPLRSWLRWAFWFSDTDNEGREGWWWWRREETSFI